MNVSSVGILAGTPVTAGTYRINLSGTDSDGTVGTGRVTLIVKPAPLPQDQGMVTSLGLPGAGGIVDYLTSPYIVVNNRVVTHDGDTVVTYHGGLTTVSVGNAVIYTYTIDIDGVYLAKTIDISPTVAVSGTARVNQLDVSASSVITGVDTNIVTLTLANGDIVEYYQPYAFVDGIGTNTSYGTQLVNYTGFINPTTGHILATSGYMSDIPVTFLSSLANATVGAPYNKYAISPSIYGMGDIYAISATGLPPGMTNTMGNISGTPTDAGTYTVTMTAMYGQHSVAPYSQTSGTITIVVDPAIVVVPPDTTAPVIIVNGGAVTLIAGDIYTDAGATCTDNKDVTCDVVTDNPVDSAIVGIYTVTYSATDITGNTSTETRTVIVDPIPVVVCSGTDQVITNAANARGGIVEIGGDPSNGGIAIQIFQASTTVVAPLTASTFFKAGNLISYVGTMNALNLCVTTSATVSAPPDTVAPIITMNGTNTSLAAGTLYIDAGASCIDNRDTTCVVMTTSTVNTATTGTYTVTYSATDIAGNIATPVVRTVTVTPVPDTTAPVITMIGGNVSLVAGGTYTDTGAACKDDRDPTCTVVKTSTVNTATAGTYTVTYRATDLAGNIAIPVVRTVTVTPAVIIPPTGTGVVSTGVKVEGTDKIITAISATTINIGTLIIRLTPTTTIQLDNKKPLKVGNRIEYKGVKNTDGSVTATIVKIQ
jgi:Domain of unknown function (DUF5011)/Domain of unknown function (DUF5666)